MPSFSREGGHEGAGFGRVVRAGRHVPAGVPKSFQKDVDATRTAHGGSRRRGCLRIPGSRQGRHSPIAQQGLQRPGQDLAFSNVDFSILLLITHHITNKTIFISSAGAMHATCVFRFPSTCYSPHLTRKGKDLTTCPSPRWLEPEDIKKTSTGTADRTVSYVCYCSPVTIGQGLLHRCLITAVNLLRF